MYIPWYIHTAANVYQHRNKFARATTAYYTYKSAKAVMPYLRGTKPKPSLDIRPYSSSRPTTRLATELKALHRKINKQKPETKHWFQTWSFTATADVTSRHDFNLTQAFHSEPAFRDNVLGDKWRNLWLDIRTGSNANNVTGSVRLIVYVPKVPNNTWPGTSMRQHIDPNDHWVLFDKILKPDNGRVQTPIFKDKRIEKRYRVNLRRIITSYDSAVRKGQIRVAMLTESETGSWIMETRFMLAYQNI